MSVANIRDSRRPKELVAFASIEPVVRLMIESRLSLLAKLSGYPLPTNMLGLLYPFLNATNISQLKENLINLRSISKIASTVCRHTLMSRRNKYVFDATEVRQYIDSNASVFQAALLSDEAKDLVVELVASTNTNPDSWLLTFPVSDLAGESNLLENFASLYSSVLIFDEVNKPETADALLKRRVYVPGSNTLGDYAKYGPKNIVTLLKKLAKGKGKEGATEDDLVMIKSEFVIDAISDIRLLDYVLSWMLNPEIWDMFIPNSVAGNDITANNERADGLADLTGFLHTLMTMSHIMRAELFKAGFAGLENWMGSIPKFRPEVDKIYDDVVASADILDVRSDVQELFSHISGANLQGEHISVIPIQVLDITSLTPFATKIRDAKPTKFMSADTDQLKTDPIQKIIMALPDATPSEKIDIWARFVDEELYATQIYQAAKSIKMFSDYFTPEKVKTSLRAKFGRISLSFAPKLPPYYNYKNSSPFTISGNDMRCNHSAMLYSLKNQEEYRSKYALKFFTTSAIINEFRPSCIIDLDLAKSLAGELHFGVKTLAPQELCYANNHHTTVQLSNQDTMLYVLSMLTNYPKEMITRALISPEMARKLATLVSSFGVIIYNDGLAVAMEQVIEGYGKPYGISYAELAKLTTSSKVKDPVVVPINSSISIAILARIPLPSVDLRSSRHFMDTPYYFFSPRSEYMDVNSWVMTEPMIQYAIRPTFIIKQDTTLLFDKTYGYYNQELMFESSLTPRLTEDDEITFSLPVSERPWKKERYDVNVLHKTIPSFVKAAVSSTNDSSEEEKLKVADSLKKIEADAKAAESRVQEQIDDSLKENAELIKKVEIPDEKTDRQ